MRFSITIAAVAILSVAAFAGAQNNVKQGMRMRSGMSVADWQKMYDQAEQMFDNKDADGLFKYMAPGFTLTMGGKTVKAGDAKKSMKDWFKMMKTVHCTMKVFRASGGGNTATVSDHFRNAGEMYLDPKSHKTGKYLDTGNETASWVKVHGQWMIKNISSSDEKMTINGKPVKSGM